MQRCRGLKGIVLEAKSLGSMALVLATALTYGQGNGSDSFRKLALSAYSDEPPKCEGSLKKLIAIPIAEFRTEATAVGKSKSIDLKTKRALAFACAVRGVDESASLKILSVQGPGEDSSVRMSEVDGLCRIFSHRHSRAALAALIRIPTDGESAELQGSLVVHLLQNKTSDVLKYLDSHPSDMARVSDMVVYELDGDDAETKSLARKLKQQLKSPSAGSKSAKKLLKAISKAQ